MIRDLSVVVVSHNGRAYIRPALRSLYSHTGPLSFEVVVVDNGSDGTADEVARHFPDARVLTCPNHGFAHANNVALRTVDARYVLLLNPDTEILEGRLSDLVALLDARPRVGLASVSQVTSDGVRWPTIKRYPSPARTFAEAIGATHLPVGGGGLGERELRGDPYERETSCDWVAGSFMLVRREAIQSAGWLDERFFLYSEEADFCLRIRKAGWDVRHFPVMTVLHYEALDRHDARVEAQNVFARLQYAGKHFSSTRRFLFTCALLLKYGLRVAFHGFRRGRSAERSAAAAGLRVALGRSGPPIAEPPPVAVATGRAEPAPPRALAGR